MKTRKLVNRIRAFFSPGAAESREARRALQEVLEKLKRKERELREQLEQEHNAKRRQELERKIRLVHSQRSKGVQLLKKQQTADNA